MAKQGADLQSSTFDQYLAYELASSDWLKDHIAKHSQGFTASARCHAASLRGLYARRHHLDANRKAACSSG
jgi:hypothetical protein